MLTASVMKLCGESLDFTSVFLQGDKPERDDRLTYIQSREDEKMHLWIKWCTALMVQKS